ncbi:MAG: hypothetical protein ABEK59_03135 [Halobacteria archaeon]
MSYSQQKDPPFEIKTRFSMLIAVISVIWGISIFVLGLFILSLGPLAADIYGSPGGLGPALIIAAISFIGASFLVTGAVGIWWEEPWAFKITPVGYLAAGTLEVLTIINNGGLMGYLGLLLMNVASLAIIYCFRKGGYKVYDLRKLKKYRDISQFYD